MAKQFQIGLPPTTGEAAEAFVKSLDQQIVELEDQLLLLRQVRSAIKVTFPPHAWLGSGVADV